MYTISDYNPSDIPATLKFQREVKPLQDEYRTALEIGYHPEKEMLLYPNIIGLNFSEQCSKIYEFKVVQLKKEVIDFHNSSNSNINLLEYKRFNDLIYDALYNTNSFLGDI